MLAYVVMGVMAVGPLETSLLIFALIGISLTPPSLMYFHVVKELALSVPLSFTQNTFQLGLTHCFHSMLTVHVIF